MHSGTPWHEDTPVVPTTLVSEDAGTEIDVTAHCVLTTHFNCICKLCSPLYFRHVVRESFLIMEEWCREEDEIITGQEVTSNSDKISRSPLAKTI